MSEYLSPAEVDSWARSEEQSGRPVFAATLREMAAVVYRLTDMREGLPHWDEDSCAFCGAYPPLRAHEADCLFIRAGKLRGQA